MPQIRLECSRAVADVLDCPALFSALHTLLVERAGASLGACKSRIAVIEQVYVADGAADRDMVHLDIGLLSGRTADVLRVVGVDALALIRQAVAAVADGRRIETSVRLVDMPPALYFK